MNDLCMHACAGKFCERFQQQLKKKTHDRTVDVTVKLHLIMPNAEKKSPVSREVTTVNYRECFSLNFSLRAKCCASLVAILSF